MEDLLKQAGLTEPQAKAYLYLLRAGEAAPPAVAEALALTRSNAYKVLDRLTELGLLRRQEIDKKFVYQAEDPIVLNSLVAVERSRLSELEKGVQGAMHELRGRYQRQAGARTASSSSGEAAVAELYTKQIKGKQAALVITAGKPLPASLQTVAKRRSTAGSTVQLDGYTAAVEWSVSGNELLIVDISHDPVAVRIINKSVADAFRQLYTILR